MKRIAHTRPFKLLTALLLFGVVFALMPRVSHAGQIIIDSVGLSGSSSSYVQNVLSGGTFYFRMYLHSDSADNITAFTVTSSRDNVSFPSDDSLTLKHYSNATGSTGIQTFATPLAVSSNPVQVNSTDWYIDGSCVLPSLSSLRKSFEIFGYIHWQDFYGTDRLDSTAFESNSGGNVAPTSIYLGKYLTHLALSATPSLYEPSTWWQNGHDNTTIRIDFSAPSASASGGDTLYFINGSSVVVQRIVFTGSLSAGLYAGVLTYDSTANSNTGGFTSVAADGDTTGATTFSFTDPALGTRAKFIDGSTYTVKLAHTESGKVPAYASYASFKFDVSAPAPTLTYPGASFQGGRDDDTIRVRFTLSEIATQDSVVFQIRTGSAIQVIRFSGTAAATYSGKLAFDPAGVSGSKFSVVSGSNDGGTTLLAITSQDNISNMSNGSTYTARVYYYDIAGNMSPNADFASFIYDTQTQAVTLQSPPGSANVSFGSNTFSWDNNENYSSLIFTFEYVSGPADNNAPHIFTVNGGDALLNSGAGKSIVFNLSSLVGTADFTYNYGNGGTPLIQGTTYRWRIRTYDLVTGNDSASVQRTFTITSGNLFNVSGTGLATFVDKSVNDSAIYKMTASTSGGSASLTSLHVDYTDAQNTALPSDITNIKLWYSALSSFATGTSTLLSTQSYTGGSVDFTGFSQSFNGTTAYLYITISTSATASTARSLYSRILTSGAFGFSTATNAAGTFPLTPQSTMLPVTMNRFTGESRNGVAYLHWVTQSEFNNAGFNVSRRIAGDGDFTQIAAYTESPDLHSKTDNGTSATPNYYDYTDNTVVPGTTYEYRLSSISLDGISQTYSMTVNIAVGLLPQQFKLESAYPNPFNSSTNVRFDVPFASSIKLAIFDVNGREVSRLVDGQVEAGTHSIQWNGRTANGVRTASGTYFVRLTSGKFNTTRKIVLLQ